MKLFYCYSPVLKKELLEQGLRYLHRGLHNETNKTFWVFEGSMSLNNYLELRKQGKN